MHLRRLVLTTVIAICALAAELPPSPDFSERVNPLQIVAPCAPQTPWSVSGEHGALFGRQNGVFEAWHWPVKILSDFRISAELQDYPVPIDVNDLAAEIRVTPAETVITYSHAAFTIHQHMFAARGKSQPITGPAAYFVIESARPLSLLFSFTPDMLRMWPAPNFGRPDGEWIPDGKSGFYVLHTDNPDVSGIVAMPGTKPGILPPYQEHPQRYPLQLKLSFDPKRDAGQVYPLVMGIAHGSNYSEQAAAINSAIPQLYAATQSYYSHFFDSRTIVDSPDHRVNEAARWAELAIDQTQVSYRDEIGMVAGYYMSADSARPGFAWFFGRDTLFTTYAVNSYGDFALTKAALDFLLRRQRADGKIMHEFSQAADQVDWKSKPYFYAAADATPLFVMAMRDYVNASGDTAYLKNSWEAVRKAYGFTRAHEADNGIYDNREGTGWVESWPPGMPHQEIYLAEMDRQSAAAMSNLAALMSDSELAKSAQEKASVIGKTIELQFFESDKQFYAFSRNADGSLDHTASIYPSVAWWDMTSDRAVGLEHADPMLSRWASSEFSTDWGTRDISDNTSFYDPISYHQGSVWPLFTGWASLAEYRAGRPLSAYAHLMQNLNLTWAQDLGSVTELLSGEFFQPLGRSTAHQMWSSAMVLTPLLRGLFGLSWDAPDRTLQLAPHLPADWDGAQLHHVRLGESMLDISYKRQGGQMLIRTSTEQPEVLCLTGFEAPTAPCKASPARAHTLSLPLEPVEIAIPAELPSPGSITSQLKVLDEQYSANRAVFTLSAMGGTSYDLPVRFNRQNVKAETMSMKDGRVHVQFPLGKGYQTQTLTFRW